MREFQETSRQQNETSSGDTRSELINFMENVLGIEDAENNDFNACTARTGKPRNEGGSRTIIARFLRLTDPDYVFKCGHKL